jgi:hypothetical protein
MCEPTGEFKNSVLKTMIDGKITMIRGWITTDRSTNARGTHALRCWLNSTRNPAMQFPRVMRLPRELAGYVGTLFGQTPCEDRVQEHADGSLYSITTRKGERPLQTGILLLPALLCEETPVAESTETVVAVPM